MRTPKLKNTLKHKLSKEHSLKTSRFSMSSMAGFVLVFGVLGIFLLFKSFASSPPENVAYGDLTGDNTVNVQDLSTLLTNYGTSNSAADINSDSVVNVIDLSILLSHYGTSVPVTGIYYVDPAGNDSNNGQFASPWKTVSHAISAVPTGSTIRLNSGTYAPFNVNKANVTVTEASGATALVQGQAGAQDVIRISSSNVTVSNLTVFGCVPDETPPTRFEDDGSSGVRIHDGTTGVTVSGMTVRDSHGTTSEGLPFGCYGILAHNTNSATISNNDIYHNGQGVEIVGGGQNVQVIGNQLHENDVIIRNTNVAGDDYGATGVGIGYTSGATPGPLIKNNTIYTNVAPSHDYTTDGGAFDVFKSSNITFDGNNIFNNENIFEDGTNQNVPCSNLKFINNTVRGTNIAGYPVLDSAHGYPHGSIGMYLRCNDHMLIDNNTFTNIYGWVFDIFTGGNFGAAIDHLTITNNTISQTGDRVLVLQVDPAGQSFTINNNHYHMVNAAIFASASGWSSATWANLAAWRSATGFDLTSTTF